MGNAMIELLIEAMIMKRATEGPRGLAEAKLVKAFDSLDNKIRKKILSHEFTDKLTNEQLNEVTVHLDSMLTGFNTFIEQLESTITPSVSSADSSLKEGAEKNPHNSGN